MSTAQDTTKARLLEAAGEEFAEKGFEGATIRSIIERARANIAAVNYHFGDKERLYIQAVIEAHRCGVDMEPVCMDAAHSPARAAPAVRPPLPASCPGDRESGLLAPSADAPRDDPSDPRPPRPWSAR